MLGYDQQAAEAQKDYLEECGPALAGLFLKILQSISTIEVVEYTLVLIDQLFSADKSAEQVRAATDYFLAYARDNPKVDLAQPFIQILGTNGQHNSFTFLRVQHILAILLAASYGAATPASRAALSESEEKAQRLTVVQFLRYLIAKISNLSNSSASAGSSSLSGGAAIGSAYNSPSSPSSSAAANNRELMACLNSLKNLLRASPRIQDLFAEQDGLRCLANLLTKETQNAQLLYAVGFNIWLLSYNIDIARKLQELGVIAKLVAVAKVNVMEKVIRISFATLRVSAHTLQRSTQHSALTRTLAPRITADMEQALAVPLLWALYRVRINLVASCSALPLHCSFCSPFARLLVFFFPPICVSAVRPQNFLEHRIDSFNEEMIGHGLPSVVDTLSKRKFKDPDVGADMSRIAAVLAETIRNMSTFDKYSVEVASGALSWNNPAHKNEIFWRENINQFDAKNFALVKDLIRWAEPAAPGLVVAGSIAGVGGPGAAEREEVAREVACYDLGEFARFHPDGKKVLARLRAKEVLMKNLQDKSPRVSKAALLATQKLMVANWEFLQKSSSGGVASLVAQKK